MSVKKTNNRRLSRNIRHKNTPIYLKPFKLAACYIRFQIRTIVVKTKDSLTKEEHFHVNRSLSQKNRRKKIQGLPFETRQTPIPTPPAVMNTFSTAELPLQRSKKSRSLLTLPNGTVHVTMNALRWVFLLIFIYLAIGTFVMLVQDGAGSVKNIIIYSVTGFITFFMGYFGWIIARDIMEIVTGKRQPHEDG